MNTRIFNELDHRLSVVKRWAILHTVQTQSVAEHIFNVERILYQIADAWFCLDDTATAKLLKAAHFHEEEEALSGDLPSMVKPYFDTSEFIQHHSDSLTYSNVLSDLGYLGTILKLADKMEGYRFLCMEERLGNQYIKNHLDDEYEIIVKFAVVFSPAVLEALEEWMVKQRKVESTRFNRASNGKIR
jgi:hypothetical protein